MKFLKSQITVIEIPLLLLLFGTVMLFFSGLFEPETINHNLEIDSFLDSILFSDNYRSLFLSENLSEVNVSGNWSDFESLLNDSFLDYEIVLSNLSNNKIIYSCDANYYKYLTDRVIAIKDNDNYEFRKIILGVCY